MSSEREDLAEVLSAHRIVGVSGLGIESVICACQYDWWTGRAKWHPAGWHPRHVAKKLRAAGWRPPTKRTDAEVDAAQLAYHEVAFGPGDHLSKRDLGITRQAMRAALEAADRARLDIDAASREDG